MSSYKLELWASIHFKYFKYTPLQVYDDNDEETIDVPEISYTETSLQEEMKLAEIKNDEKRHSSCDTGYNSEEDHRIRTTSESEDEMHLNDNDSHLDCESNMDKQENDREEDDVFVDEKEEGFNESFVSDEDDNTHQKNNLNDKGVVMVSEKTEVDSTEPNEDHTELTDKEVTDSRVEQNIKVYLEKNGLPEKMNVPDITLKKPRIIANFDYDEEVTIMIFIKDRKHWDWLMAVDGLTSGGKYFMHIQNVKRGFCRTADHD